MSTSKLTLMRGPALALAVPVGLAVYSLGVGTVTGRSPCPFLLLTGLPCPGCGGTRAVLSVAEGQVWTGLQYNAVFLVLFTLALVRWAWWTADRFRGKDEPFMARVSMPALALFSIGIVAWTVFRWTPWYPGIAV